MINKNRILIRGTTPTVSVSYDLIYTEDITDARLVVKQCGIKVLELGKTRATDADNSLTWTLTQQETLQLKPGRIATVMVDWLLTDGTRGRSEELAFRVEDSGIEGVIDNE
jgi:hypothetical protein